MLRRVVMAAGPRRGVAAQSAFLLLLSALLASGAAALLRRRSSSPVRHAADASSSPGRYAYVTLTCEDGWTPGALALGESLNEAGAADDPDASMVALMTANVSEASSALLQKVGWQTRRVELHLSHGSFHTIRRPDAQNCVPAKFELWRLEEFDKVIFLDADTLVLQDIRSLARKPELSACADTGLQKTSLNSGVMVLRPSQATYDDIIRRLDAGHLKNHDPSHGDQGALNKYWSQLRHNWHELPEEFNFFASRLSDRDHGAGEEKFLVNQLHVKVLHFSGGDRVKGKQGKPWQQQPSMVAPADSGRAQAAAAARGPRRVWQEIYQRGVNASNSTTGMVQLEQHATEWTAGRASASSLGLWCRALRQGLLRAGAAFSELEAAQATARYGVVNCWATTPGRRA